MRNSTFSAQRAPGRIVIRAAGGPRHPRGVNPAAPRPAPRTAFSQLTQVAGEPGELAPAGPATLSTIVPTTASPASQPRMNSGPVYLIGLRGVSSAQMMKALSAITTTDHTG